VNSAGDVFVTDVYNSRILGYHNPLSTDTTADVVLLQPNFRDREQNGVSILALKRE